MPTPPTPLKVRPGNRVYSSDFLPEQVGVLASARAWCDLNGYTKFIQAKKNRARIVLEWAWQDTQTEDERFDSADTPWINSPWIMHVWVVMYQYPDDPDNTEQTAEKRLAMFEGDSTGRVQNISDENWTHMDDGAELPGFTTSAYADMLDEAHKKAESPDDWGKP